VTKVPASAILREVDMGLQRPLLSFTRFRQEDIENFLVSHLSSTASKIMRDSV